jgi:CRP-like cAMP-binding protein
MTTYLDKINDYFNSLDYETQNALHEISSTKQFRKGELLLRQDETCNKSYLIQSGITRKYYLNDGKEITTEIYFENDLAVSFDSYTLQKPSKEFFQALTDVTISIAH